MLVLCSLLLNRLVLPTEKVEITECVGHCFLLLAGVLKPILLAATQQHIITQFKALIINVF